MICPFCSLADDLENDFVGLRTTRVLVVPALKQRPLNRGHMLILPTAHVTRMIDVEAPLAQELYTVAGRVSMAIRKAFAATGATVFQNDNAPDQELSHVHIHVIPRKTGDDFKLPDPSCQEVTREERIQQAQSLRRILG
jgi:diadenosine tetraphosphate (Ap4A) HIT family hydrolase